MMLPNSVNALAGRLGWLQRPQFPGVSRAPGMPAAVPVQPTPTPVAGFPRPGASTGVPIMAPGMQPIAQQPMQPGMPPLQQPAAVQQPENALRSRLAMAF
jgi:hypothetical protein